MSVRETALGLIAALCSLNPVLAELSLVFTVGIDLHVALVVAVVLLVVSGHK